MRSNKLSYIDAPVYLRELSHLKYYPLFFYMKAGLLNLLFFLCSVTDRSMLADSCRKDEHLQGKSDIFTMCKN